LLQFTPTFPSPRILPQRQMVELTTPPPGAGSICFFFSKPPFDHSHIPLPPPPPPPPVAVAVAASQHGEQNIYVLGISRTLVSLSYGGKKRCSPFCCSYYYARVLQCRCGSEMLPLQVSSRFCADFFGYKEGGSNYWVPSAPTPSMSCSMSMDKKLVASTS
jgi:hypothetical protein